AKVVILRALPSGPKSDRIFTESRGFLALEAKGYSMVSVTHSRPWSSKAMLSGFRMSGSAATSCASKPGGSLKPFSSRAGFSGLVSTMSGFGASERTGERAKGKSANSGNKRRMASLRSEVRRTKYEVRKKPKGGQQRLPRFSRQARFSGHVRLCLL